MATDGTWPLQQDAAWLSVKQAHRIVRASGGRTQVSAGIAASILASAPSAMTLPTRFTARTIEPEGSGTDDAGKSYADRNYWNMCAPGAATVAAYYFGQQPAVFTGTYREPYGPKQVATHWDATDVDDKGYSANGRAYILYMAEAVYPPSFTRAGIDDFDEYPTHGGSADAIRDALNWEMTDRGIIPTWATYFYAIQGNSGARFTQAHLNADIVADIAGSGAAVVVDVDADYLPNWPDLAKPLYHSVTVVGYDNDADTYTYLDTCGRNCGSYTNGGLHTIAQKQLFKAIQMVGRVDPRGLLIKDTDGTPKYPIGAYIW